MVSIDSRLRKASWLCQVKGNMIDGLGRYVNSWRENGLKQALSPVAI